MKKVLLHNLTIPFINELPETYHFTQNGLFFANDGDAVVLHKMPDEVWLSYMRSIGAVPKDIHFIESPKLATYTSVFEDEDVHIQIDSYKKLYKEDIALDVFIPSGYESFFAQRHGFYYKPLPNQYEDFVSKSDFKYHAQNLHLPTVPGISRVNRGYINTVVEQMLNDGCDSVVVKQDDGVSGKSSVIFSKHDNVLYAPTSGVLQRLGYGFVIEKFIQDVAFSPSVQAFIGEDGSIDISPVHNQLFREDKITFIGNQSSHFLPDEIIESMEKYAYTFGKYINNLGFFGYFGIDAIFTKNGSGYLIELNPRRIMSSYGCEVISKLGFARSARPHYTNFTIDLFAVYDIARIFDILDDLLYTQTTKKGIVPLLIQRSQMVVLCIAEDVQELSIYKEKLLKLFPQYKV